MKTKRPLREKINLYVAKTPQKAVLVGIMLFNVIFILIAAGIISILSHYLNGMSECSFWVSLYRTITMILDAGCIESIISDVGKAGAVAAIICVAVIIFGMIFFTGAVIGYVTNGISSFIDSKNNGKNKLFISNHIVFINWNSRAAEIINEFLYAKKEIKIVVFVPDNKEEIDEEIRNRLDTTLMKEAEEVYEASKHMTSIERKIYKTQNLMKDNITYIVREGDVEAATDLDDICISEARTVIILDDSKNSNESGNIHTVKTLMQVSEISKANSKQQILVEVSDDWTRNLVRKIIEFKSDQSQETIIPVSYNLLLGHTYAQIAVSPVINDVYDNLFSNREFQLLSRDVSEEYSVQNENAYFENLLSKNCHAIPITVSHTSNGDKVFFLTESKSALEEHGYCAPVNTTVSLRKTRKVKTRSIIMFGHNSNMDAMIRELDFYHTEMKTEDGSPALKFLMVDDGQSLKNHNYYKDYPNIEILDADIFDFEIITNKINELYEYEPEELTLMILSDDLAEDDDIDANALTYLIYIQEEIHRLEKNDPDFNRDSLNVIVEILNPKNEDIVRNYGADRVIIGNRYLSHLLSRICLGKAFYDLYEKSLTYNNFTEDEDDEKVIYAMKAEDFFEELPGKCTAYELIRMVYKCGDDDNKAMLFGYIRNENDYIFFYGDQRKIEVELKPDDVLMFFGYHW